MWYDESHLICFTQPEFYGDAVTCNDKMMDSMADIQPTVIVLEQLVTSWKWYVKSSCVRNTQ